MHFFMIGKSQKHVDLISANFKLYYIFTLTFLAHAFRNIYFHTCILLSYTHPVCWYCALFFMISSIVCHLIFIAGHSILFTGNFSNDKCMLIYIYFKRFIKIIHSKKYKIIFVMIMIISHFYRQNVKDVLNIVIRYL